MKDPNIIPLNFDTTKHDAKVAAAKLTDEQKALLPRQKRLKKFLHSTYLKWVAKVKKKERTPTEIVAATYELQASFGAMTKEAEDCGLKEWHEFGLGVIEDKIAQLVATGVCASNQIIQFIPNNPTVLDEDNNRIVREQMVKDAKPVTFRTLEDLQKIDFVKRVCEKEGFAGLCLYGRGLVGYFKDDQIVEIGILVNGVGVERLPLLEDYIAALKAMAEALPEPVVTPPDENGNP